MSYLAQFPDNDRLNPAVWLEKVNKTHTHTHTSEKMAAITKARIKQVGATAPLKAHTANMHNSPEKRPIAVESKCT